VAFEEEYVVGILGGDGERSVREWSEGVGGHWERQRRVDVLGMVREVVLGKEGEGVVVEEEMEISGGDAVPHEAEDKLNRDADNADGWGFDEDESEEKGVETVPEPPPPEDDDPSDAWGWNDDEANTEEQIPPPPEPEPDAAWDDPWGEDIDSPPIPKSPRTATRLEKFSSKGKKSENENVQANGRFSKPISVVPVNAPPIQQLPPLPQKEIYLISLRTQQLLTTVSSILHEAHQLSSSSPSIFPLSSSSSPPGTILRQTASAALDLWRGLYPVAASAELAKDPGRAMRFSNECLWLSREVGRVLADGRHEQDGRMEECKAALTVLGESWFHDTIVCPLFCSFVF
jgi:protein transport protein DSL1/ZW10